MTYLLRHRGSRGRRHSRRQSRCQPGRPAQAPCGLACAVSKPISHSLIEALTLDGTWKVLEHPKRTGNDLRPPVADGLGHGRGVHLEKRAERRERELLVVHARQAVLAVDRLEPLVEEEARRAGADRLHDVQSRSGVVQYRVDQDLEVGETKRARLNAVYEVQGGLDDGLETLYATLRQIEFQIEDRRDLPRLYVHGD